MAEIRLMCWIALVASLCISFTLMRVEGQMMGGMGMGNSMQDLPSSTKKQLKKDAKLIGCDVCERMVMKMRTLVEDMRENAPYKKIHEDDIAEILEKMLNAKTMEGQWITKLDIMTSKEYDQRHEDMEGELYIGVAHPLDPSKFANNKDVLVLVEKERPGHCSEECFTIEHSARSLLEDEITDLEDLVVALWKGLPLETLLRGVCTEMSDRCTKKRKAANYERRDWPFHEMSDEDLQYQEMMAQMQSLGHGSGAQILDQDAMMNMAMGGGMGGMGGMDDYYGDMDFGDMDFGGMGDYVGDMGDFGDMDFGGFGAEGEF